MTEDNTIITDFKMKMAMILRGNEMIEDLRFRPAAMVKNFEPKTRTQKTKLKFLCPLHSIKSDTTS